MKLKFLKTANDKYSGVVYEAGKEYEFEEKRAKEILSKKGFAVEVKETVVENVENVVESSNENTETIEKPKRKRTSKKTTTKKN